MSTPNNKEHVALTKAILKDFGIVLTEEEEKEISSLPTEERVDRWKIHKIKESWGDDKK